MVVIRAVLAVVLVACSGAKSKPTEDARATARRDAGVVAPVAIDASVDAAAPAPPKGGDLQVRVEWRDVPVAARAPSGRTACNTPRRPAVEPTTTWGVPDAFVIVDGAAATDAPARIVLRDCLLAPRVAAGPSLLVESASEEPAQVMLAKRGEVGALAQLGAGKPRTILLPIAGHAVSVELDAKGVYELATAGKQPDIAWVIAAPATITDAAGHAVIRELAPGTHEVTAWLPPRAGQPARIARGTAEIKVGELADVTLQVAPVRKTRP